jgi:hypothetical protein
LPPPARNNILVPQRFLQHLTNGIENFIPHIMAIAVIDKFKVIQVGQQYGKWLINQSVLLVFKR